MLMHVCCLHRCLAQVDQVHGLAVYKAWEVGVIEIALACTKIYMYMYMYVGWSVFLFLNAWPTTFAAGTYQSALTE